MTVIRRISLVLVFAVLFALTGGPLPQSHRVASAACEFFVAPTGSDGASGTLADPWASIRHAATVVPDTGCTVTVMDGTYVGAQEIERRFTTMTLFRAANPYGAILTYSDTVLDINGATNVTVEGFEITHAGPGSVGYVALINDSSDGAAQSIIVRNNIIHDSYENDLLKAHNGSTDVQIIGNIFYNQGSSEQHLDINGVRNVTIEQNVFFNDYAASGRPTESDSKHFIVIKDSNEDLDGFLGARDITVRSNVFANWQGGVETFIRVGNDGKPYFEADGVDIENNLMVGNSPDHVGTILGVSGARDVSFVNNTVVGDLPSNSYAIRLTIKGDNPANKGLVLANNIWSDPTGTMGSGLGESDSNDFSSGDPGVTTGIVMDNNLYWNGPVAVPSGDVVTPTDDTHGVFADPLLPATSSAQMPVWSGAGFADGSTSVSEAFSRLVETFGQLPVSSPVAGTGSTLYAPATDILGLSRGASPSVGAVQAGGEPIDSGRFTDDNGSIFEADIEWLAEQGITLGCNPAGTLFCPDDSVSRAQMAAFMHRALEGVLSPGAVVEFTDDDGSIFEADIEWLAAVGVTLGCNPAGTLFCPDDSVSRAQMAAFMHRALEGVLSPGAVVEFTDDDGSIFEADIEWLAAVGVTLGCNPAGTLFCPDDSVSRAQMAAFMHRGLG